MFMHIMLAYLKLLTASFYAVCLYNDYLFIAIDFGKCLCLWAIDSLLILFIILHHVHNHLVFLILCSH